MSTSLPSLNSSSSLSPTVQPWTPSSTASTTPSTTSVSQQQQQGYFDDAHVVKAVGAGRPYPSLAHAPREPSQAASLSSATSPMLLSSSADSPFSAPASTSPLPSASSPGASSGTALGSGQLNAFGTATLVPPGSSSSAASIMPPVNASQSGAASPNIGTIGDGRAGGGARSNSTQSKAPSLPLLPSPSSLSSSSFFLPGTTAAPESGSSSNSSGGGALGASTATSMPPRGSSGSSLAPTPSLSLSLPTFDSPNDSQQQSEHSFSRPSLSSSRPSSPSALLGDPLQATSGSILGGQRSLSASPTALGSSSLAPSASPGPGAIGSSSPAQNAGTTARGMTPTSTQQGTNTSSQLSAVDAQRLSALEAVVSDQSHQVRLLRDELSGVRAALAQVSNLLVAQSSNKQPLAEPSTEKEHAGEESKDDHVKLLAAQVSTLTSAMTALMSSAPQQRTTSPQFHRQPSLPPIQQQQQVSPGALPSPNYGIGIVDGASHNPSAFLDPQQAQQQQQLLGANAGGIGLGVGAPGGKSPVMRPSSSLSMSQQFHSAQALGMQGATSPNLASAGLSQPLPSRPSQGSSQLDMMDPQLQQQSHPSQQQQQQQQRRRSALHYPSPSPGFDLGAGGPGGAQSPWMDAPSPAIGGGATPSLSTGLPSFATTPQLVSTPNLSASTTSTAAGVQPTGGSLASKWDALGVGQDVFRCLVKYGMGPPSKIQAKAIPCVLRNQDVVSQAPSIQERIQCYVVPALQSVFSALHAPPDSLTPPPRGIQIMMVTATVDQSAQAQRLAHGLGANLGIRTALCVGQGDPHADALAFQAAPPHIIIGTPQRLLELLGFRLISTADIRMLVIDECDQLIARNLADFVSNIVRLLPPSSSGNTSPVLTTNGSAPPAVTDRQTAIFSCTVPQDVLSFASSLQLREPVRVLVRREGGDHGSTSSSFARGLKQFYLYIALGSTSGGAAAAKSKALSMGRHELASAREWKLEALADLCEDYDFQLAIVYCNSLEAVEAVSYKLGTRAIDTLALHPDIGAPSRQSVLSRFRAPASAGLGGGQPRPPKRVLVVVDSLARSLHEGPSQQQVSLVINFDLPRVVEDYVPRVSCAAASGYGRAGVAINFVTPGQDVEILRAIEGYFRCKISELPPSLGAIA